MAYTHLWEQKIYISFQLHIQWCDFGSLLSSRVRVFTTWKLVNITYCFSFFSSEIWFTKIPLLLPFLSFRCTVSMLYSNNGSPHWSFPIMLSDAKYLFLFMKIPVCGTYFPFRRKGVRKDERKYVEREWGRKGRKLHMGESAFEIVMKKLK